MKPGPPQGVNPRAAFLLWPPGPSQCQAVSQVLIRLLAALLLVAQLGQWRRTWLAKTFSQESWIKFRPNQWKPRGPTPGPWTRPPTRVRRKEGPTKPARSWNLRPNTVQVPCPCPPWITPRLRISKSTSCSLAVVDKVRPIIKVLTFRARILSQRDTEPSKIAHCQRDPHGAQTVGRSTQTAWMSVDHCLLQNQANLPRIDLHSVHAVDKSGQPGRHQVHLRAG